MTEVNNGLDAREATFIETEAATVATIATGLQTGRDGFLLAWSGMAVLLYRSHSNLVTAIKGAGEKQAKPGLPSGYITRLAGYLSGKTVAGENSVRQYLSALNQLVEKGGKNTDGTIRALCSNGDSQKLADHFKAKGLTSWADISGHARRNSEGGASDKKQPGSERVTRLLKETKPKDIVDGLSALPNSNVVYDMWTKARVKAGAKRRK
jgi:hypothetical protein